MAFDGDFFAVVSILPEGNAKEEIVLKVAYDKLNPDAVTSEDIIGGYDTVKKQYKGLECISQVYGTLGIVPGQIIVPGFSQDPAVAAVMRTKTENISGLFQATAVVDIDSSGQGAESYEDVYAWKNQNSYAHKDEEIFSPLAKTVPLFNTPVFPAFPKPGNC